MKEPAEGEMVRKHHQVSGHEFEQTPGDSGGQGSLVCGGLWGCRVGHNLATEQPQHCFGNCIFSALNQHASSYIPRYVCLFPCALGFSVLETVTYLFQCPSLYQLQKVSHFCLFSYYCSFYKRVLGQLPACGVGPSMCSLPTPCYTAVASFLCSVLTLLFWFSSRMEPRFKILCAQSCLTLCSLLGFLVCGPLQARILEWVAISSSRGCSPPIYQTHIFWVSCIAGRFLLLEPLRFKSYSFLMDIHLPNWI